MLMKLNQLKQKITWDKKLNSEAYLLKLEPSAVKECEFIYSFCKNAVLHICQNLKRFYVYRK